eukprot:ANDGO_05558.mRNA.1 Phosphoglycerate kinase
MNKLSVRSVDLAGKRILLRVDFNVPMKDGKVTDATRISATIPTVKYILSKNPKNIIILSHLGRPEGKRDLEFSLQPLVPIVQDALGEDVTFVDDIWKDYDASSRIVLYENIRFYPEEEGKKQTADQISKFNERLTSLCDIYVNDAFGAAHRAHASIVGVKVPVRVAGLLMAKEIDAFRSILDTPARPLLAIVGGAKVADKIALLENLIDRVDSLLIGGGMAFTFLKQLKGIQIGKSLFDEKGATTVESLMKKADAKGVKIHLPTDYVIADRFAEDAESKTCNGDIPDSWLGLDIGPETSKAFADVIAASKTVVWNGPMGVFEMEAFSKGSRAILDAVRASTKAGHVTVCGGGDTGACVQKYGAESDVAHLSTGGGASLELLEGKKLPGIAILSDA